jgi:uncharacterized protein YggE
VGQSATVALEYDQEGTATLDRLGFDEAWWGVRNSDALTWPPTDRHRPGFAMGKNPVLRATVAGMPIAGRRVVVALALLGTAAAVLTGCDSKPAVPVGANPRQVTVVGAGQVQGVPDTLTADVSVEAAAADVTTAMNQANDRQNSVLNALNASGIDGKDISTTQVSLQPQYGDNSVITGYRASNAIQIKIRKLDTASQVLANVVSAGGDATRINSVSYSIEDDSKLVTDARARAFNDAKQRAQQYAELSGLSLGTIISISEAPGATPTPPVPMPAPRGAMATAVPLQPGQQTVGFSVTAVWELH